MTLVNRMYYIFTVESATVRESRVGTPFIQYTLVKSNGDRVFDNVAVKWNDMVPPVIARKITFYQIPRHMNIIEDKDLQHVVGKKARLKVHEFEYNGKKYFNVEITNEELT
jgi:hypothetical protein